MQPSDTDTNASSRRDRRTGLAGLAALALAAGSVTACGDDADPVAEDPPAPRVQQVHAAGTNFAVQEHGEGRPLLVIHGAGEDAAMLEPFAIELAAAGRRVITYDRRGTGGSGRNDWPGGGAGQHADDAAAILQALGVDQADVVGLSSGGVIALDLVVRHPKVVASTFLWEAPAIGAVPGGEVMNADFVAPIEAHLAAHQGDYVGAQAILLTAILGFPVAVDDPRFAATREHAESMVRDDPTIVTRPFTAEELAEIDVVVAVGEAPNPIVAAAGVELASRVGTQQLVVPTDDHEVHLNDPAILARAIEGRP